MSQIVAEFGPVTGTVFYGKCEACGCSGPHRLQITGRNGYVGLCLSCLTLIIQRARDAVSHNG